jgi:hypothetical protein
MNTQNTLQTIQTLDDFITPWMIQYTA